MDFNNGKVRVLMLKGEKGDRGADGTTVTYLLSKNGNTVTLTGSDGTTSSFVLQEVTETESGLMSAESLQKLLAIDGDYVGYSAQQKTTNERLTALGNAGLHVGRIPPDNVTTDLVPVGELYLYLGQ